MGKTTLKTSPSMSGKSDPALGFAGNRMSHFRVPPCIRLIRQSTIRIDFYRYV